MRHEVGHKYILTKYLWIPMCMHEVNMLHMSPIPLLHNKSSAIDRLYPREEGCCSPRALISEKEPSKGRNLDG